MALHESTADLRDRLVAAENELAAVQMKFGTARVELQELKKTNGNLCEHIAKCKNELADSRRSENKVTERDRINSAALASLQAERDSCQQALSTTQADKELVENQMRVLLQSQPEDVAHVFSEHSQVVGQLRQANDRIAELEEAMQASNDAVGERDALKKQLEDELDMSKRLRRLGVSLKQARDDAVDKLAAFNTDPGHQLKRELRERKAALSAEQQAHAATRAAMMARVEELQRHAAQQAADMAARTAAGQEAHDNWMLCREKLERMTAEKHAIQEQLAAMQASFTSEQNTHVQTSTQMATDLARAREAIETVRAEARAAIAARDAEQTARDGGHREALAGYAADAQAAIAERDNVIATKEAELVEMQRQVEAANEAAARARALVRAPAPAQTQTPTPTQPESTNPMMTMSEALDSIPTAEGSRIQRIQTEFLSLQKELDDARGNVEGQIESRLAAMTAERDAATQLVADSAMRATAAHTLASAVQAQMAAAIAASESLTAVLTAEASTCAEAAKKHCPDRPADARAARAETKKLEKAVAERDARLKEVRDKAKTAVDGAHAKHKEAATMVKTLKAKVVESANSLNEAKNAAAALKAKNAALEAQLAKAGAAAETKQADHTKVVDELKARLVATNRTGQQMSLKLREAQKATDETVRAKDAAVAQAGQLRAALKALESRSAEAEKVKKSMMMQAAITRAKEAETAREAREAESVEMEKVTVQVHAHEVDDEETDIDEPIETQPDTHPHPHPEPEPESDSDSDVPVLGKRKSAPEPAVGQTKRPIQQPMKDAEPEPEPEKEELEEEEVSSEEEEDVAEPEAVTEPVSVTAVIVEDPEEAEPEAAEMQAVEADEDFDSDAFIEIGGVVPDAQDEEEEGSADEGGEPEEVPHDAPLNEEEEEEAPNAGDEPEPEAVAEPEAKKPEVKKVTPKPRPSTNDDEDDIINQFMM